MKDAVNLHMVIKDLKIKTPIPGAESIELLSISLDFSEALILKVLKIFFTDLEFIEEFKLFQCAELGNLGRADFIENNLEHGGCYTVARKRKWEKADDSLVW